MGTVTATLLVPLRTPAIAPRAADEFAVTLEPGPPGFSVRVHNDSQIHAYVRARYGRDWAELYEGVTGRSFPFKNA